MANIKKDGKTARSASRTRAAGAAKKAKINEKVSGLKKGARVTGDMRDQLIADLRKKYERGASIRTLAETTGRSYGFIRGLLGESGVQIRGTRSSRVKDMSPSQSRAIKNPKSGAYLKKGPSKPIKETSSARARARRLIEALPESKLTEAIGLIEGLLSSDSTRGETKRDLSFIGLYRSGRTDVAKNSSKTLRREMGETPGGSL